MHLCDLINSDLDHLVAAGGLGLLVGRERERHAAASFAPNAAGIRTHVLLSLCGFVAAWLAQHSSPVILPATLLVVGSWSALAYVFKARQAHYGLTSEVAMLLTFLTGACALVAPLWLAAAIALTNTLVLSEKNLLEQHVLLLDRRDFLAALKFLIVAAVIFPALPDQPFTPFALNPRHIWKVVVLVSSIGYAGYLLSQRLGTVAGLWLSALLGGLVSSTAVTVALGRAAQQDPQQRLPALQASLFAGAVSYLRIFILIWLLHPATLSALWWQLSALAFIGLLLALFSRTAHCSSAGSSIQPLQNPFDLPPALMFAAAYTGLTLLTQLVRKALGPSALYILAALVGVTDITPFALSLIHRGDPLDHLASQAIILALFSNTIMKAAYFIVLVPAARSATAWRYALWAVAHLPFLFLF